MGTNSKTYAAEWRAKNKEKTAEYQRQWREKNKEKIAGYMKAWHAKQPKNPRKKKTPEEIKTSAAEARTKYKAANVDKLRAYGRARYAKNPDAYRAQRLKREYGMTPEEYDRLLIQQQHACAIARWLLSRNDCVLIIVIKRASSGGSCVSRATRASALCKMTRPSCGQQLSTFKPLQKTC